MSSADSSATASLALSGGSNFSSKSMWLSRVLSAVELRMKGRCKVKSCVGVVHKCSARALQMIPCNLQVYCKETGFPLAARLLVCVHDCEKMTYSWAFFKMEA